MRGLLETMKDISICNNTVTIKSTYNDANLEAIESLINEIS